MRINKIYTITALCCEPLPILLYSLILVYIRESTYLYREFGHLLDFKTAKN